MTQENYPQLGPTLAFRTVNSTGLRLAPGEWFTNEGKVCAVGLFAVAHRGIEWAKERPLYDARTIAAELGAPEPYVMGLESGFEGRRVEDRHWEDVDRLFGEVDGAILRWCIEEDEELAKKLRGWLEVVGVEFEEASE